MGEQIAIGNGVTVTVEEKSGRRVRLRFDADESVKIHKVDNSTVARKVMLDKGVMS